MRHRSAVVWVRQELFLIHRDLRERVGVQRSVLVLVRKSGSDGLVKQRDHMVEAGRTSGRRTVTARKLFAGTANQHFTDDRVRKVLRIQPTRTIIGTTDSGKLMRAIERPVCYPQAKLFLGIESVDQTSAS